ncbi:hypothetical protein ACFFV7_51150 [Nonomuraea spiralis]|uniref:Uncharacterized protein n=1 Tax=Nonomuraea spiralis TaxID=46182 RepID=A0ABV5J091_9ACTN|nr:hypothetical protein [Nonomuraea spiralis]
MNIFPPSAPTFAIRVVDGDKLVGILHENHPAAEAERLLRRIRDNFPASTLAEFDGSKWQTVDDEQLKSAIYQHTMYVLSELTRARLPLAHWQLAPYQPDKLTGTLHISDADKARKAIEAYAAVLGVTEISERESEHAVQLELGEVVWAGVRIELSTYTRANADAASAATTLSVGA